VSNNQKDAKTAKTRNGHHVLEEKKSRVKLNNDRRETLCNVRDGSRTLLVAREKESGLKGERAEGEEEKPRGSREGSRPTCGAAGGKREDLGGAGSL